MTTTRATLLAVTVVASRFRTAVGGVRVALAVLGLFAQRRRFATCVVDRLGQGARDQLHGANGVIVAGDRHRDEVRIGVRVADRDERDAKLVGLVHRDALLLGVDDKDQARQTRHRLDARQVLAELVAQAHQHQLFFLGVVLKVTARLAAGFEILELLDLLLDGCEVREQAAKPALGDVHRAALLGFRLDEFGELLLGAHEEHAFTAQDDFAHELLCEFNLTQRLLQIDDVNPVALRKDEPTHLRVPTTGLVAEVYAGLEEFVERGLSHDAIPDWLVTSAEVIAVVDRPKGGTRRPLIPPEG